MHEDAPRVEVGEGASIRPPSGSVEWQLRYGNPEAVKYLAASMIESYSHLVRDCTLKEAARRLRLMRAAIKANPKAYE